GNPALAIGNVIGSNIANIALILGLAGLFSAPIAIGREIYSRDGFIMLAGTLLFFIFSLNGLISRLEAGVFLFLFLAYLHYFFATKKTYKREFRFKQYLREYADLRGKERFEKAPTLFSSSGIGIAGGLLKSLFFDIRSVITSVQEAVQFEVLSVKFFAKQVVFALVGAFCVFLGANFLVRSASLLPFDQVVVGLVFVAIGTSLPELAVTISSLKKGLPAVMIGNIIGSNISNVFLVGGLSALASPLVFPISEIIVNFVFLLLVSWLFLVFLKNNYRIERIEAFTLLLIYCFFLVTTFKITVGA
ncbi:MAG: sodium:calcium antiporter, partial [Candidatus Diapherotrites archaeon]|nr:sodium:calcium antiporter [Candidatus Diapherotrites archaeon]